MNPDEIIRQQAVELVECRNEKTEFPQSVAELLTLLREAEVRQAELELRNVELNEKLLASQQITEVILNAIPVGVFWKDKNLEYLGCNRVFANAAGFSDPDGVIGKNDYMMGWHDQAELYRADDKQVIDTGEPKILIEEPLTLPDGSLITLLTGKIPLKNVKGDVFGVLGTFMDITSRRQAQAIARQTKQNYETFFDTIDDFFFVLDEEGRIIHANATVYNRLGFSKEELLGISVLMVHPPDRREEAGKIVQEMLIGIAEVCPVPIMTKEGIQIPVETRVSKGFWDGAPALFGVTKDISKLKLSEEKFSKLFHINPSACGLSDLLNHQYIEVNDAFCLLFGYNKNEVIGKTASELGIITPEAASAILQTADKNGVVTKANAELRARNGDIKQVQLSAENIYIQDKIFRFTVVHDITELKKAEAEIKLQNQNLLSLNADKDKFFAIVAHDLRNPFQSLLGFSRLMVEDLPTLTLDEIQKMAMNMRTSANKLYNLLENLLEWSMLQRGMLSFKPESFLLWEGLESNMELVREAAGNKCIDIRYDIPENQAVVADIPMFGSLIRNLLFNAVKYTPKGGNITIKAKPDPDNSVEISISDTGIGMNQEMVNNLFQSDRQTNRRGTDDEPSSGLGLVICRDFVQKHGGKIWIESEEGKGSTFSFTLKN